MDTIVAVATPPGRSAIAVIRMSGPQALDITRALVHDDFFTPEPAHMVLKDLKTDDHEVMDQALITFFKSPHSFTGEDMVEISCHGSPVTVRKLLDRIQQLDARLAPEIEIFHSVGFTPLGVRRIRRCVRSRFIRRSRSAWGLR